MTCFFLPKLADKYGRLTVYRTTIILTLPLFFILNLSHSIGYLFFVMFMLGVALIGRFTCGFVLLTESVPKKNQSIIGGLFAVSDCIATLYITFLLRYVTNNALTIIWIGFGLNFVAAVLSFFLVESPEWMASVGAET